MLATVRTMTLPLTFICSDTSSTKMCVNIAVDELVTRQNDITLVICFCPKQANEIDHFEFPQPDKQ